MNKLNFLWQVSPTRAWILCLLLCFSVHGIIYWTIPNPQLATPLLVTICSILLFDFLVRLPTGVWWVRLLTEALHFIAAALIFFFGNWALIALAPQTNLNESMLLTFSLLALFSHSAVRLFARPYALWKRLRRRRLVWEITHAQLQLVLLTMFVVFLALVCGTFNTSIYMQQPLPEFISIALTLLLALGGFFGIITGGLLFIVLIPASLISYLTARRITRRLNELVTVTRSINEADYDARVTVQGEDEIAHLQADFNHMMDQLEAARQQLQTERDAVSELLASRQRLFADVSHELRTPVATIRGYLDSLKSPQANTQDVAIIEREVLRLQHLIDDVFTLARSDMDKLPYDIQTVEIGTILERITQTMNQQTWSANRVQIVLDYQPQIPLVLVDETRFEQVMYNLLRNGVRHTMPGGLIRVSASTEASHVRIDVQDTGEGIAPEDLPHIWDRFYRSAATRAQDATGSGLGLALVKEMVEAMDGEVSVISSPGKGSCFSVILRRAI